MGEMVVTYLECEWYEKKGSYMEENKEQGVLKRKRWKEMRWCGCLRKNDKKKVAYPRERKA